MSDREFPTILGIPARVVGSSHWTDEEFETWISWERMRSAYYAAQRAALVAAGWKLWTGHWYEGGREVHGTRARHPEHSEDKHLSFDQALDFQRKLTPEAFPERPKPPKGLPQARHPMFNVGEVKFEPMRAPEFKLLNMTFADQMNSDPTIVRKDEDE
jgi:hypothetical protein